MKKLLTVLMVFLITITIGFVNIFAEGEENNTDTEDINEITPSEEETQEGTDENIIENSSEEDDEEENISEVTPEEENNTEENEEELTETEIPRISLFRAPENNVAEDEQINDDSSSQKKSQFFEYQGDIYKVCVAIKQDDMQYSDDDGSVINVMTEGSNTELFICILLLDEYGNSKEPASPELTEIILNSLNFGTEDNSHLSVGNPVPAEYTFKRYDPDTEKETIEYIDTKLYTITINNENKPVYGTDYNEDLIVSFKVGNDDYVFGFTIEFDYSQYSEFVVDSDFKINGTDLNTILSSKANLKTFYETSGRQLTNDTSIVFLFETGIDYVGSIEVNCYESDNNLYGIYFDTNEYQSDTTPSYNTKKFNKGNKATIKGNVEVNGGNVGFAHLNFVSNASNQIGIIRSSTLGDLDITECSFTGYNIGYKAEYGQVTGSLFEDNRTGVLFETDSDDYDVLISNCYFNENTTSVYINGDYNELKLEDNCFYGKNNTTDYMIGGNVNGVVFTKENFFAKSYDLENVLVNNNVRSAFVSYERSGLELVTSPCIRYPQNEYYKLGIDNTENIITKFVINDGYDTEFSYDIDLIDLNDLDSDYEIELYDLKKQKDIVTITFKANEIHDNTQSSFAFGYDFSEEQDKLINLTSSSNINMFEEYNPTIKVLRINKGDVYYNDKQTAVFSYIDDYGNLIFEANHSGQYYITLPSDYSYVGPSEDSKTKSSEVQKFTINSNNELQFVFKNISLEHDNAYYDFVDNGKVIYIDNDSNNRFILGPDDSLYKSEDGCLILVFYDRFLNSLPTGTHKLSVKFSDGLAEASFTVNNPTVTNNGETVPEAEEVPDYRSGRLPATGS